MSLDIKGEYDLVFDVETKKFFDQVEGHRPEKLGLSYVGAWMVRSKDELSETDYRGFFEYNINDFWPLVERSRSLVGFNLIGFDLPVLSAYYSGDFSVFRTFDLMDEMKKVLGHRVSLNAVAKGTLGEEKNGSGMKAIDFYNRKDWANLEKYCKKDVELTARLFQEVLKNGKLRFQDKWNEYREVELSFGKTEKTEAEVQMTLV
jgi:DEAD/DEAH box helicase domain-containing protein